MFKNIRYAVEAKHDSYEYTKINTIIQRDIYAEYFLSGGKSSKKALQIADKLELILNKRGFYREGIIFKGKDPAATTSTADDKIINVAGKTWFQWT